LPDLLGAVQENVAIEGFLPGARNSVRLAVCEEDEELLTTVAAHNVARPGATGQAAGQLPQNFVANEMAMGVIDLFEMINVAQE
jgi:hypothetical protein